MSRNKLKKIEMDCFKGVLQMSLFNFDLSGNEFETLENKMFSFFEFTLEIGFIKSKVNYFESNESIWFI